MLLRIISKHAYPMFDLVVMDISCNTGGGTTRDDVATSTTQVSDCDPWSIWLHYAGKTHSRLFHFLFFQILFVVSDEVLCVPHHTEFASL